MTDEIKELLDYLIDEECTRRTKCITIEESKQLLDYITNLQQENEKLKQTLHNITINGVEEENTTVLDLINENETLKAKLNIGKTCGFCPYYKYKQRIDKAVEYINNNKLYDFEYDEEEIFEIVSDKIARDYLLNILQGSDEECTKH